MDARNDALLPRRTFLALSGFTVAAVAGLTACGDDDEDNIPSAGVPTPTTGLAERRTDDIVLLRTGSSTERSLMFAYDALIPILPADAAPVAETFRAQHAEQAEAFDTLTDDEGGRAFLEPNQALQLGLIEPTLAIIADQTDAERRQADAVIFAHSLESIAASTYQSFVPLLTKPALRSAVMSVGTAQAKHAAVLARFIDGAQPVAGLDTLDAGPTTIPATTTTVPPPPPTEGSGTTTTTSPALTLPPDGVFQVPGPFGSLVEALGPNSYTYDERTITTTAEG